MSNEETTAAPIAETIYFKYANDMKHRSTKPWTYVMITKEGYDIRVRRWFSVPTIDLDELEPTQHDLDEEVYRVKMHYTDFQYIKRSEFMEHYNIAYAYLHNIVTDEKSA